MKMINRFIFSVIISLSVISTAQAQATNQTDVDNLYLKALSKVMTDDEVIIERDALITDGLPTIINSTKIEYLQREDLIGRVGKSKRPLRVIQVSPITNKENRLIVTVSYYYVIYVPEFKLNFEFRKWVYFNYDCNKNEFVVENISTLRP